MVETYSEHPTLRDRLRSGLAIITRAHPAALLLAVAGAGFLAPSVLIAPLASFAHAIHADEAIAQRGDPDAAQKDGRTAVSGTAPAPAEPATTPSTAVASTETGGSIPAVAPVGCCGSLPLPSVPAPPRKSLSRAQQEPAAHPVRYAAPQRQARAMQTQPYHTQGRGPEYAGRSVGGGNQQFMRPRPYPGAFNRNGWGSNFNRSQSGFRPWGGGGWFHGGGRRR